jgi:hypothetical protein
MWAFQPQFVTCARSEARRLLHTLGCDIEPHVFLAGFLAVERWDRPAVCVEPGDCCYRPELFTEALGQARALWEAPGRVRLPGCLAGAVCEAVRRHTDESRWLTWCAAPSRVDDYFVCLVLQIGRAAYEAWPHLKRRTGASLYPVWPSLLDAALAEFLECCSRELSMPNPGQNLLRPREASDLVRSAGRRFMVTAAQAGGEFLGLHGLFDACNTISSLRYEGAEGAGHLVIAPPEHPALVIEVRLTTPVRLTDYRAARKLLQLCSPTTGLLSNSDVIYGLGRVAPSYDPAAEDLFVVRFVRHHTWEVLHAGRPLMRTTYGEPRLPLADFDRQKFARTLRRLFRGIPADDVDRLAGLAESAAGVKHGTVLVISTGAAREAARLEQQCTRIHPVALSREQLGLVAGIDGAVLLDTAGTCHAIGVILDGRATPRGTSARGARYNSTLRYVDERKDCLAVIVSEDGTVDVVPDLLPQIARSDLHHRLGQLRELASAPAPDRGDCGRLLNWFDAHRFYLSADACEEVNRVLRQVDARLPQDHFHRVYGNFVPSRDLNDTYFLDE